LADTVKVLVATVNVLAATAKVLAAKFKVPAATVWFRAMVMVLEATVKAPWLWCRSRPLSSHWVFDSLRPNDKVLPRSRFLAATV
jgi:hypothetical protein